jgi:cellulose synthase/poly-beta-1,6-N-acetylglucosamine synthase-like glycosyltransferase
MRAAADTGCDVLARTDADAIPAVDWVATIRRSFARGHAEMISGVTVPIRTEVSPGYYWVLRFASLLASVFGTLRATNYGAGKRGIYVMTNGNNLAITTAAYLAVGGFARTRIEDLHEDRALVNAVRSSGLRVRRVRAMRVAVSSRRVKAWGLLNSLRWYRSHHQPTADVDIR